MTHLKKLLEEKPREAYVYTNDSTLELIVTNEPINMNKNFWNEEGFVEANYAQRLREELERCVKALGIADEALKQYGPIGYAETALLKINKLLGGDE